MSDVVELSDLAAEEPRGLAFEPGSKKDKSSRFWRAVWRVHFYAGMAVLPFLVILAVTGTAVLYKDIINSVFERLTVKAETRDDSMKVFDKDGNRIV